MSAESASGPHGERRYLIEQVTSAWRPCDRDGRVMGHPAWYDIAEPDRLSAYTATVALRRIEAALDPRGLSATGRRVLERVASSAR